MPRALVTTTSLARSSGNIRLPTPAAGLWIHRRRDSDGNTSRSTNGRERDFSLGQQTPKRLAIPGVQKVCVRKGLPQIVDEAPRHHPDRALG